MTDNITLPFLRIQELEVQAGQFRLQKIDFSLHKGDYLVLLGQSGAGKTLLLESMSGLHPILGGRIIYEGKDITRQRIQHRPMGLLFQDHAVFPHLRVASNIGYSLSHLPGKERARQIISLANKLEISHLTNRMPEHLSGGEKQRVALARILAREPGILLLDEPLSSLDVDLRKSVRGLLRRLNLEGQTIIHVTHDPEEAMALANKVGILEGGILRQFGTPGDVFGNPRLAFVASFTGIQNFIPAALDSGKGDALRTALTKGGNRIRLYSEEDGGKGHLLIRGQDIILSRVCIESSALNTIKGQVRDHLPLSKGVELLIEAGDAFSVLISQESAAQLHLEPGQDVWMSFKASAIRFVSRG